MFSQDGSAALSDKFTAVKLLGGNDLDDEGKAFMKRYGVGGYPTLLAMTPDGAVVSRSFGDRTLEGIVGSMVAAVTADGEFRAKEADLASKTDAASVREMAGLYKARSQLDKARTRYEKLTAEKPSVEDQENLLEVVSSLGDSAARKGLLATLVGTRSDHAKHIEWRTELAMVDVPTQVTSRAEWNDVMGKRKAALTALLPEVEKVADQAHVRGILADIAANTGDRDAAGAHWDWILEKAPDSKAAAGALWMKSNDLIRQGRFESDATKLKDAKALWGQLVKDHATSPGGQRAKQFMGQLDGMIAALELKQAEAAEKKLKQAEAEEKKKGEPLKPRDDGN